MTYWNIANDNWTSNIISTFDINKSYIKCMNWFKHNWHQCTPMTTAATIANNTNTNLSISNINMIIVIHFVTRNTARFSNISTTTSNTININYITPPKSTFDALQSNSITNTLMTTIFDNDNWFNWTWFSWIADSHVTSYCLVGQFARSQFMQ